MMAAMEPARKSVLIQWVKKYKDTNGGQLPKPGSLPSELGDNPISFTSPAAVEFCTV